VSAPQESPPLRWPLAHALATSVLYTLAMPPFELWPLAFACLAPLAIALAGRALRARVALSAVAGLAAGWATSLAPAGVAWASFFERPLPIGIAAAALATGFFGAVGFAAFGALAGDPTRGSAARAIVRFGAAFAIGEWVRSQVATGMPWLLLAHALAPAPRVAQLADPLGVIGLGALVSAGSAAIAIGARRRDERRTAVAALALLALAIAAADVAAPPFEPGQEGAVAIPTASEPQPPGALRVAIVQPATPLASMHDPAQLGARLDRLAALSQQALPADLVVWPENAFGAALPANEATVRARTTRLEPPAALLFGAPRYDRAAPTQLRNAALLWDAAGRSVGAHDKVRLLPFTEYVPAPFERLGMRGGHATAGDAPTPLPLADTKIGVLICYELLFPRLAESLVAGGAGLLVNPSNDAWFGGTAGSRQMLAAGVLRAIETRRPLLRVTPNGISAAIDARGRVVARLERGASAAIAVDVWPERP